MSREVIELEGKDSDLMRHCADRIDELEQQGIDVAVVAIVVAFPPDGSSPQLQTWAVGMDTGETSKLRHGAVASLVRSHRENTNHA